MIEIKKYTAQQLYEFAQTSQFRELSNQPTSLHRALSYLHNPRLDKNDIIAYIAFDHDEIVGYRTLLPDSMYFKGQRIRFAWHSGNWVKLERRREGVSLFIFKEVHKDWKGMLAYTNYAPESKAVYDKSEQFKLFYFTPGLRCYLGFDLYDLLPPKSKVFAKIKPLLKYTDLFFNVLLIPWIQWNLARISNQKYTFQYLDSLDPGTIAFIEEKNQQSYTFRTAYELDWIERFPWVIPIENAGSNQNQYFFSTYASKVYSFRVKISDHTGQMIAFMVIHSIDNRMTIPYFFREENCDLMLIGQIIKLHQLKLKCPLLTVYNADLVKSIEFSQKVYLKKKTVRRNYFAAIELYENIKELQSKFNDGDGDCAFT